MLSESFKTIQDCSFWECPKCMTTLLSATDVANIITRLLPEPEMVTKKNHPLTPRGIPWPKQTTYLWDIWCITILFFWITAGDFFHLHMHKNSIEHLQWKERKHFHTLKTISSLNCPDLVHSGEYVHNFVLIQVQCNKMWHSVTTYKR